MIPYCLCSNKKLLTNKMAAISYIEKLLNYSTRNLTTYELDIDSREKTITHNLFTSDWTGRKFFQRDSFQDFIRNLLDNFENIIYELDIDDSDKELLEEEAFQQYDRIVYNTKLFNEFEELVKIRKK